MERRYAGSLVKWKEITWEGTKKKDWKCFRKGIDRSKWLRERGKNFSEGYIDGKKTGITEKVNGNRSSGSPKEQVW